MLKSLLYRLTILRQYIKDILRCHKNITYEKIRRVYVSNIHSIAVCEKTVFLTCDIREGKNITKNTTIFISESDYRFLLSHGYFYAII